MKRLNAILSLWAPALCLVACSEDGGGSGGQPWFDGSFYADASPVTTPDGGEDASTFPPFDSGWIDFDAGQLDAEIGDAQSGEAGSDDAGQADAGSTDASGLDGGDSDGSVADASLSDASVDDANVSDANVSDANVSDAGLDGSAPDASAQDAGGEDPFARCTAALKPKCRYDEKETACSSMTTPSIPLTGGGTWGNNEIKGGPYGAYVEWNEGKAFANAVDLAENTCFVLASAFGEPASVTQDILDLRGADLSLYTVFRPACMKPGEKYPVITWGNGTCGQSGGYGALLASLASHGFVVIAANSRFTDAGRKEMLRALDYAKAANEDPLSPLYQKLDLSKVGAMGHSQGASATEHAAPDARIKAVILWNGSKSAVKPFLSVSGDRDINAPKASDLASAVQSAAQPGAWLFYHKVLETGGFFTGHLTLMMQPERVIEPTVAWWKYMLNGDSEAKKMFVGSNCGLCNKASEFEFGQKNLP